MPHQLTPVLLAGVGAMADAYAAVLRDLGQAFIAAGRSEEKAQAFAAKWQTTTGHGPLQPQLDALPEIPSTAIVAVSANQLAETSALLIQNGVKRLLIEKPAGLTPDEVEHLSALAQKHGAEAYIAYNRRFYASTEAARRMIAEDGGALSLKFDFTEASKRIEALNKPADELAGWFYGNSTHVIDLAFFLGGEPAELAAQKQEQMPWHPAGAVFTGIGTTQNGAAFSYHANWLSPGRWGVEVMTRQRRLVLQPMEQLFYQDHAGFSLHPVELANEKDTAYKPGLYHQTAVFLSGRPDERLLPLQAHARLFRIYQHIRDGGAYRHPHGQKAA